MSYEELVDLSLELEIDQMGIVSMTNIQNLANFTKRFKYEEFCKWFYGKTGVLYDGKKCVLLYDLHLFFRGIFRNENKAKIIFLSCLDIAKLMYHTNKMGKN
jgi:hypothetical protein